jgi:DnaK suppressor protein
MDTKTRDRLKKCLLMERERLINQVNTHLSKELTFNSDDLPDETDAANTENLQRLSVELRGRDASALSLIDEALEKFDSEDFGICEDCGYDIESKRLQARPTAILCINCQEAEERRSQIFARH